MKSSRRLYLAADKTTIVGEGDDRAAFLLVGAGCEIDDAELEAMGLDPEDVAAAVKDLPPEPRRDPSFVPPHPGSVAGGDEGGEPKPKRSGKAK